jgi:hypothetical protein
VKLLDELAGLVKRLQSLRREHARIRLVLANGLGALTGGSEG